MKLFKYWRAARATARADGRTLPVTCYGGSNESADDASARAADAARRAAEAVASGRRRDVYLYGDRPLREEIVEQFGSSGNPSAAITRNAYGALVLNTARVLFADVDLPPEEPATPQRGWLRLFRKPSKPTKPVVNEEEKALARLRAVTEQQRDLGMRVYRTAAGLRCLVTTSTYSPTAAKTRELLEALGSDPLYVELCRRQECFRARLTAKFWRCDAPQPPFRFPWSEADGSHREAQYRAWEKEYHERADRFAACRFLASLGNNSWAPEVEPIVAVHDARACQENAELA